MRAFAPSQVIFCRLGLLSLLADPIALTDLIGEPLPFVGQLLATAACPRRS